jgi:hypothetical protein
MQGAVVVKKPKKSISELFKEGTPIDEALRKGVRDALIRHKKLGNSIVIWRDGKIVHVPADQIEIPDEEAPPH